MRPPLALRFLPAVAYRLWFTPPPRSPHAASRDAEALAGLERFEVRLGDGRLASGYRVGEGPLAMVFHGWGGRPAQMSHLARRLAEQGMQVVIVELPGGAGGPPTDAKKVVSFMQEVIGALGDPQVVVAHSFAALLLRLVEWRKAPARVVMAAPAVRVSDTLRRFASQARLAPWVAASLRRRLRAWDRDVFAHLDRIDVEQLPGSQVLVVHDPDDPDTPFGSAAEFAALRPRTELVPVTGAGHNGVLRHPRTLDEVARFLGTVGSRPPAEV